MEELKKKSDQGKKCKHDFFTEILHLTNMIFNIKTTNKTLSPHYDSHSDTKEKQGLPLYSDQQLMKQVKLFQKQQRKNKENIIVKSVMSQTRQDIKCV